MAKHNITGLLLTFEGLVSSPLNELCRLLPFKKCEILAVKSTKRFSSNRREQKAMRILTDRSGIKAVGLALPVWWAAMRAGVNSAAPAAS